MLEPGPESRPRLRDSEQLDGLEPAARGVADHLEHQERTGRAPREGLVEADLEQPDPPAPLHAELHGDGTLADAEKAEAQDAAGRGRGGVVPEEGLPDRVRRERRAGPALPARPLHRERLGEERLESGWR